MQRLPSWRAPYEHGLWPRRAEIWSRSPLQHRPRKAIGSRVFRHTGVLCSCWLQQMSSTDFYNMAARCWQAPETTTTRQEQPRLCEPVTEAAQALLEAVTASMCRCIWKTSKSLLRIGRCLAMLGYGTTKKLTAAVATNRSLLTLTSKTCAVGGVLELRN